MTVVQIPEQIYAWLSRVMSGLAIVGGSIALFWHIFQIYKQFRHHTSSHKDKPLAKSLIFSVCLFIFGIIQNSVGFWIVSTKVTKISVCQFVFYGGSVGYVYQYHH